MKRKILLLTFILGVTILASGLLEPFKLCGAEWRKCMDINYAFGLAGLIFAPLFFFSLITYFMKEEVFRAWLRFSTIWVPLTMVCTLLAPDYSQSLLPIVKGSVSFFMSLAYSVLSVIIILTKMYTTREKK
jgi:hypothetical protein